MRSLIALLLVTIPIAGFADAPQGRYRLENMRADRFSNDGSVPSCGDEVKAVLERYPALDISHTVDGVIVNGTMWKRVGRASEGMIVGKRTNKPGSWLYLLFWRERDGRRASGWLFYQRVDDYQRTLCEDVRTLAGSYLH
jgi:hypothetical protein